MHTSPIPPQQLTKDGIYKLLFAGERLTIPFPSRTQFDTLRTSLVKLHARSKLLDMSNEAVCASWDPAKKQGTYWLGAKRQPAKVLFNVTVEPQDEQQSDLQGNQTASDADRAQETGQIRSDLGRNQESPDRSESMGGSQGPEYGHDSDYHQHGAANQEQSPNY